MLKIEEILNILQLKFGSRDRVAIERALHERLKKQLLAPQGGTVDPVYETNLLARAKAALKLKANAAMRAGQGTALTDRKSGTSAISVTNPTGKAVPEKRRLAGSELPTHPVVPQTRSFSMELRAGMADRAAAASSPKRKIQYEKIGEIWINGTSFGVLDDSERERFLLVPRLSCTVISLLGGEYRLLPVDDGRYTEIAGLKLGDVVDVLNTYKSSESSAHAR